MGNYVPQPRYRRAVWHCVVDCGRLQLWAWAIAFLPMPHVLTRAVKCRRPTATETETGIAGVIGAVTIEIGGTIETRETREGGETRRGRRPLNSSSISNNNSRGRQGVRRRARFAREHPPRPRPRPRPRRLVKCSPCQ